MWNEYEAMYNVDILLWKKLKSSEIRSSTQI